MKKAENKYVAENLNDMVHIRRMRRTIHAMKRLIN